MSTLSRCSIFAHSPSHLMHSISRNWKMCNCGALGIDSLPHRCSKRFSCWSPRWSLPPPICYGGRNLHLWLRERLGHYPCTRSNGDHAPCSDCSLRFVHSSNTDCYPLL